MITGPSGKSRRVPTHEISNFHIRRRSAEQRGYTRNLLTQLWAAPVTEADCAAWRAAARITKFDVRDAYMMGDMPARRRHTSVYLDMTDTYTSDEG